jgi:hypothetical protein
MSATPVRPPRPGDLLHLLRALSEAAELSDTEDAHLRADAALLEYIGNPAVTAAYNAVTRWYA